MGSRLGWQANRDAVPTKLGTGDTGKPQFAGRKDARIMPRGAAKALRIEPETRANNPIRMGWRLVPRSA